MEYSLEVQGKLRETSLGGTQAEVPGHRYLGEGTLPSSGPKMPLLGSNLSMPPPSYLSRGRACRIKSTVWESHRPSFKAQTRCNVFGPPFAHL